jgi:hypothetical protein
MGDANDASSKKFVEQISRPAFLSGQSPAMRGGESMEIDMTSTTHHPIGAIMNQQQFSSCIKACYDCAAACDMCAAACLREADPKTMARCIALDIDCAELCRAAAACMARGSEFAEALCQTCAEICNACGDECAKHKMDHCQRCAEACRRCAEECRNMAAQPA